MTKLTRSLLWSHLLHANTCNKFNYLVINTIYSCSNVVYSGYL